MHSCFCCFFNLFHCTENKLYVLSYNISSEAKTAPIFLRKSVWAIDPSQLIQKSLEDDNTRRNEICSFKFVFLNFSVQCFTEVGVSNLTSKYAT